LSTLDLGWKKQDPGSGINIPDPQHWQRTQNYQCTADSPVKVCEVIFLYTGKTDNRPLLRVFEEAQDFFDPKIFLSAARGNLGIKKVAASSKNQPNGRLCVFPAQKNNLPV
jgi:hypothetical protein